MTNSTSLLREVFVRYIRPLFEYATPSWVSLKRSQLERLEKLQRRAIMIILKLPYTQHLTPLDYAVCSLTPLLLRRNLAYACYGYKLLNGLLPRLLCRLTPFTLPDIFNLRRRSFLLPNVTLPTSRAMDQSPLMHIVKLLNALPAEAIAKTSLESFKKYVWDKAANALMLI